MLITQEPELRHIPVESLHAGIQPRAIQAEGVRRLVESMRQHGFLPQFPIVVSILDDGYRLLAGHHRVEAARKLPCTTLPALIYRGLTSDEEWHLAVTTNRAHEAATLPTFVDDAELVWKLMDNGKTGPSVAEIMGWKSHQQVYQYNNLHKITAEGWQLIATTTREKGLQQGEELVAHNATPVASPFTENVLREIVSLTPAQQLELIKNLLKDPSAKAAYRKQAERYKARNTLIDEAQRILRGIPDSLQQRTLAEIYKGHYDAEYLAKKMPGERFHRLMQQCLDEHAQKQNYTLHCGDCLALGLTLPAASVDVIVTDPPYGAESLEEYDKLAQLADHLLKPGGSLVVMCGQYHLFTIYAKLAPALSYYWTLAYLTPGAHATQIWQREVNSFWKPVLWFVKEPFTGDKWIGDVAKSPMNGEDKTHHKWGQSEGGMRDILERVSRPGELVCDPFMGAGTTGLAALSLSRKFLGMEVDPTAFATAETRLLATSVSQE